MLPEPKERVRELHEDEAERLDACATTTRRCSTSFSPPANARPSAPTFEDKLAQRAIVMVLETVYEQDFLPCSFGFA
jgi:hypothetical protein